MRLERVAIFDWFSTAVSLALLAAHVLVTPKDVKELGALFRRSANFYRDSVDRRRNDHDSTSEASPRIRMHAPA
jgi:hypothetical protein